MCSHRFQDGACIFIIVISLKMKCIIKTFGIVSSPKQHSWILFLGAMRRHVQEPNSQNHSLIYGCSHYDQSVEIIMHMHDLCLLPRKKEEKKNGEKENRNNFAVMQIAFIFLSFCIHCFSVQYSCFFFGDLARVHIKCWKQKRHTN